MHSASYGTLSHLCPCCPRVGTPRQPVGGGLGTRCTTGPSRHLRAPAPLVRAGSLGNGSRRRSSRRPLDHADRRRSGRAPAHRAAHRGQRDDARSARCQFSVPMPMTGGAWWCRAPRPTGGPDARAPSSRRVSVPSRASRARQAAAASCACAIAPGTSDLRRVAGRPSTSLSHVPHTSSTTAAAGRSVEARVLSHLR